jgi:hypothetical protein
MLAAIIEEDTRSEGSDEESGLLLGRNMMNEGKLDPKNTKRAEPTPNTAANDEDDKKKKEDKKQMDYSIINTDKIKETTRHVCTVLFVFCITVAIMGVCMQFFPAGVVCVLLFSLLTCSCMPVMNITLYASALWLLIQGWTLTNQGLSLVWHTPL